MDVDSAQGPAVAGLPAHTRRLDDQGREIYLVGTAHVSLESIEDVRKTVELVEPDAICVELCQARYEAFTRPDAWQRMDVFKVIKDGKAVLLLSQLIMSAFYKRMGDRLGVRPGADMLEGIRLAHERDVELVLADRDVQVTLKRTWRRLGLWNKLKLLFLLLTSTLVEPDIDKEAVDDLKRPDRLGDVLVEFAEAFPAVKQCILDERDIYLAQRIREAEGQRVVAVVGAGHVPGIARAIHRDHSLGPLETVPERSFWSRSIKWLVPFADPGDHRVRILQRRRRPLPGVHLHLGAGERPAGGRGGSLGPGPSGHGAGRVPGRSDNQPQPHHRRRLGFGTGSGLDQEADGWRTSRPCPRW